MGRFREFEAILQDNKTDSPCKNSSEISLPNVNQLRRSDTKRPHIIRVESDTDKTDSDDSDDSIDGGNDSGGEFTSDGRRNATQQSEALRLVHDQLKKSTNDSKEAVKYYIDQLVKKNTLKDKLNARLDILYRLAESRNLSTEEVLEQSKKIQEEIYGE